ncbi:MAG TPA: hypothetical protein VM490_14700 [Armatimonadaceae bacterium]|nr:hypothetical protein [Armatimonadaceae bacterium]
MSRRIYLSLLTALLLVGVAVGGSARRAGAQQIANVKPDVQIVVLLLPNGEYEVSAVYPRKVAQAEAERPMKALLGQTKWKATPLRYDNSEAQTPDSGKTVLSSVSFTTGEGLADTVTGTVEIEPFIRAFRETKRMHVSFFLPPTFAYRGVRQHADKNVEVSGSVQQGTITYVVNIKNHQLESVQLPKTQPVSAAPVGVIGGKSAEVAGGGGTGLKIALLVLAAAAVGILVFTVASRAVRR